jgi:hypothetical protein
VVGASYLGWKLESRDMDSVVILANGARQSYDVLACLEFNSDRKRMSLLLRDPQGTIKLVTKGADSVMLRIAAPGQPKEEAIRQHLVREGRGWGGGGGVREGCRSGPPGAPRLEGEQANCQITSSLSTSCICGRLSDARACHMLPALSMTCCAHHAHATPMPAARRCCRLAG